MPFSPVTPRPARTNDPRTWSAFDRALAQYSAGRVEGVGFVFSRDDPYAGVDLDGCRDPGRGASAPWATHMLEPLRSYAEVSPSGTGVQVIVRGGLPCAGTGRRRRLHDVPAPGGRPAEIEAYHYGRFFALTGMRVDGRPRFTSRGTSFSAAPQAEAARPGLPQGSLPQRAFLIPRSSSAPGTPALASGSAGSTTPAAWTFRTGTTPAPTSRSAAYRIRFWAVGRIRTSLCPTARRNPTVPGGVCRVPSITRWAGGRAACRRRASEYVRCQRLS